MPLVYHIPRANYIDDINNAMMLLPFRTKRHEKNNNNGERKQIKYEIKRIRVNE